MIKKVNKNKFGVIEYLIEDMEDLKNLPKKDTDNTTYAIMKKGDEKSVYLYSSSTKEWVLINGVSSSVNGGSPSVNPSVDNNIQQEYTVELEKFEIYNDGTNPQKTIDGINRALEYCKNNNISNIYFPKGTYNCEVDASEINRIRLYSNTNIRLDSETVFMANPNNKSVYALISIKDVENVSIRGGKIKGDKPTHTYGGGEYQSLIHIWGAKNVILDNVEIFDSPCLGIRLAEINYADKTYKLCENVTIKNCSIHDINQCGIAVEGVDTLRIINNNISKCFGLSIETGIDIEGKMVKNCIVSKNVFKENGKVDMLIYNFKASETTWSDNIIISENILTKKMWIECANNDSVIKVINNTIMTDDDTSGDLATTDFNLYVRGKNINFSNNDLVGSCCFYDLSDSTITNNKIEGKKLSILECKNVEFNNILFSSTEDKWKNVWLKSNSDTNFINFNLVKNAQLTITDNNKNISFTNLSISNFTTKAIDIYGTGAESDDVINFYNTKIFNRSSTTGVPLIFLGSAYLTVKFDNLDVKNILSTSANDITMTANCSITINNSTLELNKALTTISYENVFMKFSNCTFNNINTTGAFIHLQGGVNAIVDNCTFNSKSTLSTFRSDASTTSKLNIISNSIFNGCTKLVREGDIDQNNIMI